MVGKRSRTLMAALLFAGTLLASPAMAADDPALAKEILKRSIAFKTVAGEGQVPKYAAYLASVLKEAGFSDRDIEIIPVGETASLIARFPGRTREKPILLIGHMDVVAADPKDWERDPFTPIEENGYIYGRGSEDNKFDVSMMVATLAQLKREGYKPRREIILALSGAEETSWASTRVLAERLKHAELALNGDGGGGILSGEYEPIFYGLQAGEKTYADFQIEGTDPGGHSSTPTNTNPIFRLARGLARLDAYDFPVMSNELTVASLRAASKQVGGALGEAMARFAANPKDEAAAALISAQPEYVGQIRTTCVATMLSGGHAPNALPQRATANVNCRIFPGVSVESVRQELARVIADDTLKVTLPDADTPFADASPLRPDLVKAVTKAVKSRYPKLEVTPSMSPGATDGLIFRAAGVPTYGVSALLMRPQDSFAHGLNERVPVNQIAPALAHYRSIIKDLTK